MKSSVKRSLIARPSRRCCPNGYGRPRHPTTRGAHPALRPPSVPTTRTRSHGKHRTLPLCANSEPSPDAAKGERGDRRGVALIASGGVGPLLRLCERLGRKDPKTDRDACG